MSTASFFPLIKAPETWPLPVVATLAMLALAALDLAGSVAAKEWVHGRSVVTFAVGMGAFIVLWWVYASALQYAELAVVTLGWVVVLQVGLLLVDHFRYAVQLPAAKWVAVVVVLAAQAYLLLAPGGAGHAPS